MVVEEKRLDVRVAESRLDKPRRGVQSSVNTRNISTTFQQKHDFDVRVSMGNDAAGQLAAVRVGRMVP